MSISLVGFQQAERSFGVYKTNQLNSFQISSSNFSSLNSTSFTFGNADSVSTNLFSSQVQNLVNNLSVQDYTQGKKSIVPKRVGVSNSNVRVNARTASQNGLIEVQVNKLGTTTSTTSDSDVKLNYNINNNSRLPDILDSNGEVVRSGSVTINGQTRNYNKDNNPTVGEAVNFLNGFSGVDAWLREDDTVELRGANTLGDASDSSNLLDALGLETANITSSLLAEGNKDLIQDIAVDIGETLTDGTVTINGQTKTFTQDASTSIWDVRNFLRSFSGVSSGFDGQGRSFINGVRTLGSASDTSNLLEVFGYTPESTYGNPRVVGDKVYDEFPEFEEGETISAGSITINGETRNFTQTENTTTKNVLDFFKGFSNIGAKIKNGRVELTNVSSLGSTSDSSNLLDAVGLGNSSIIDGKVVANERILVGDPTGNDADGNEDPQTVNNGSVTIDGQTREFTGNANSLNQVLNFLRGFDSVTKAGVNSGNRRIYVEGAVNFGEADDTSNLLDVLGINEANVEQEAVRVTSSEVARRQVVISSDETLDSGTVTLNGETREFNTSGIPRASDVVDFLNGFTGIEASLGLQDQIQIKGVSSIGDASDTSNLFDILQLSDSDIVTETSVISSQSLAAVAENHTFSNLGISGNYIKINGVQIDYNNSTTLGEFIEEVNAADNDVTASFDFDNQRLVLERLDNGPSAILAETNGDILKELNVDLSNQTIGESSEFVVDGVTYESASNNVDSFLNGLSVSFLQTGPSSISIQDDTDEFVNQMTQITDDINAVIDDFNTQQAKGVSFDQDIVEAIASLFENVTGTYTDTFRSGQAIGFSVERNSTDGSITKINIDSDKLLEALAEDKDALESLLFGKQNSEVQTLDSQSEGILVNLDNLVQSIESQPVEEEEKPLINRDISINANLEAEAEGSIVSQFDELSLISNELNQQKFLLNNLFDINTDNDSNKFGFNIAKEEDSEDNSFNTIDTNVSMDSFQIESRSSTSKTVF